MSPRVEVHPAPETIDEPSPIEPGHVPVVDALGGAAATGHRLRLVGSWTKLVLPPALVFVGFIGLWYLISSSMTPQRRSVVLPYPQDVWNEAFADSGNRSELLNGLWVTTQVALVGLLIAIALGVAFAVAMSQAGWIERSFYPYAVALQAIPILALVPLIGTWWGFEFRSRVLVCVIIAIFPIITNTLFGLKSADRGLHDLFTLHDASRWTRFRKLQLPAALPAMFTGLRISAGLAVIGAIVGEFFFRRGERGLGILIDVYRSSLEPELMIGAVFWSAVLGIAVFIFFGWLANRTTRSWHESADSRNQ